MNHLPMHDDGDGTEDAVALPDFETSLPMMLSRALDAIMPAYRDLFAAHGLTEQQWRVLRVLWTQDRANAAQVSAATLLSAPSLVGILDRLERKGLVSRIRSVEDRRAVHIVTTPEGRALQRRVARDVAGIHDDVRNRLTCKQWDHLAEALQALSTPAALKNEPMRRSV